MVNFHLNRRNAELSWKQLSKTASASTDDGADPDAAMKKTIKAADRSTEKRVSVRRENIWELQKNPDGTKGPCARLVKVRRRRVKRFGI